MVAALPNASNVLVSVIGSRRHQAGTHPSRGLWQAAVAAGARGAARASSHIGRRVNPGHRTLPALSWHPEGLTDAVVVLKANSIEAAHTEAMQSQWQGGTAHPLTPSQHWALAMQLLFAQHALQLWTALQRRRVFVMFAFIQDWADRRPRQQPTCQAGWVSLAARLPPLEVSC